jgi:hypothetical protein
VNVCFAVNNETGSDPFLSKKKYWFRVCGAA